MELKETSGRPDGRTQEKEAMIRDRLEMIKLTFDLENSGAGVEMWKINHSYDTCSLILFWNFRRVDVVSYKGIRLSNVNGEKSIEFSKEDSWQMVPRMDKSTLRQDLERAYSLAQLIVYPRKNLPGKAEMVYPFIDNS